MVDVKESLGGMLPNVSAQGIMNGAMWFLIGSLIVMMLGYITWYIMRKRRYNEYLVEILDKDSNGNVYKTYDRAGVFLDKKTGYRLLFLEKAKAGLNPNKIPYISHKTKKGKLVKTVYLRRIGVNNYVYIDMKLGEAVKFTIGEEDLNNAAQEMSKIRRTYDKKSWLDKLLAPMIFIVTIIVVMIILISLFNKFGIVKEVSANMLLVTEKQAIMIEQMLNMTNGTNIFSGGNYNGGIIRPPGISPTINETTGT